MKARKRTYIEGELLRVEWLRRRADLILKSNYVMKGTLWSYELLSISSRIRDHLKNAQTGFPAHYVGVSLDIACVVSERQNIMSLAGDPGQKSKIKQPPFTDPVQAGARLLLLRL